MNRWDPTTAELMEALGGAAEGLCVTDIEGRIMSVNRAFAILCGCKAPEMAGLYLGSFIGAGSEPDLAARLRQTVEHGRLVYEDRLVDREGREAEVDVSCRLCGAGERQAVVHLVRDISLQKAAENELRESQKLLRLYIEQAPHGIITWNLDFQVTEWNEAAVRIFGWQRSEALGRHAAFIVPEAYREHVDKVWHDLMAMSGGRRSTNENVRQDGRIISCDWYNAPMIDDIGGVVGVISLVVDVTEIVRLAQEREILNQAIEQSVDAFVVTDREGTIQYVNPAFENMTGYSFNEAVGQNPRLLQSGRQSREFYIQMWNNLLSVGTWTGDLVNRRKDGSLYTENMTISAIFKGDGTIGSFVAAKRDVTRLRDLDEQLFQGRKMEAVGRLAGGIAHDFNNMLNVIIGYTELAIDALPDGHPVADDLREIEKAAHRSADLTRQLLTFSRKQVIEPRSICLNDVVENLVKTLGRLIGEHIELQFLPQSDLWDIMMDPAQVDQILANLATNARDSMSRGGHLVISTANLRADEAFCREQMDLKPGDYVMLTIRDDGSGMDPEVARRIFEPFYTTKVAGKGTGLGLATVKGVVDQNRGHIALSSVPGQGTTFQILLPRTHVAHTTNSPARLSSTRADSVSILLVEDDDDLRGLAHTLLEKIGYKVLSAASPLSALQYFQDAPDAFQLLLTDVVMPGMNGHDLHARLLEVRPGLPVVFMSGYAENVIVDNGVIQPGLVFLQKPFGSAELSFAVQRALGIAGSSEDENLPPTT